MPARTIAKQHSSPPKSTEEGPRGVEDISGGSDNVVEEEEPSSISEDEDYVPPAAQTMKASQQKKRTKPAVATNTGKTRQSSISKLQQEMNVLKIEDVIPEAEDSIIIVPNRKTRQVAAEVGGLGIEYIPQKGEVDTVKKKKRYCQGSDRGTHLYLSCLGNWPQSLSSLKNKLHASWGRWSRAPMLNGGGSGAWPGQVKKYVFMSLLHSYSGHQAICQ